MKLFYKILGEGQPLLLLHGLFGSADNWLTHAKNWSQHYKVYMIDQRNHGHSSHHQETSYSAMAEDLFELVVDEQLRDILLLGHSMGGKTAMAFAQEYSFLIEKMVIVDMGIKAYPPHHQRIFDGLRAVQIEECISRHEAEQRLLPFVPHDATRQFLLKNMYWKNPKELAWRFNHEALESNITAIMRGLPMKSADVNTLFIRGETSDYIADNDWPCIQHAFPKSQLITIPQAGHWVHAESPQAFSNAVLRFLEP
jgi:esterase